MTDTHSLRRTSPKGPGQAFLGTCTKCGTDNLPVQAVSWPCVNPANITQDEALIIAVECGSHD